MDQINIVGAGLTGSVIASQLSNCIVYECDRIGGLCIDNEQYQEYVHIFHTPKQEIWDFIAQYTEIKAYQHYVKSYVEGKYLPWIPSIITPNVQEKQMKNYGVKMWRSEPPQEALDRCQPKTGTLFDGEMQGILNSKMLFKNLLKDKNIIQRKIKDGDLTGTIILTGAIDEYFNYCYGKLLWRGMKSCHCQSETGLEVAVINFPNDFPFIRMIDYQRLGYQNYIGFEFPSNDCHYPVNTSETQNLYLKYKQLAEKKGIILAGRLANYKYMDMDDCVEQALETVKQL